MKKIAICLLIIVMTIASVACTNEQNKVIDVKTLVVMVADTSGMGDQGFNDAAWAGCEKAKNDYNIDIRCLESETQDDYTSNLQSAADDGAKLIVAMGSSLTNAVKKIASQYPDTDFLIIDGTYSADNVASISFNEEQGAFLSGVAAACTTKTNVVGFIGGRNIKIIKKYEYGFTAGVKSINEKIEVLSSYSKDFNQRKEGKKLAIAQNKKGADVIFHAAGTTGLGMIDAAGEKGFWAIGVDKDQSVVDSKHVLCSLEKSVSNVVYDQIKSAVKNKFKGETKVITLVDKGMSISDNAGNLSDKTNAVIEKWSKAIVAGKVIVPNSKTSLANYTVPKI